MQDKETELYGTNETDSDTFGKYVIIARLVIFNARNFSLQVDDGDSPSCALSSSRWRISLHHTESHCTISPQVDFFVF